jgi:two-component system response regulator AtoC
MNYVYAMNNTELAILLLEDDFLTMQTNKRLLGSFGKVKTATTKQEAEAIVRENKIDIAFFDLNIKGKLTGLEMIKEATEKEIYSIVVSGETRKEVLKEAFLNGAKDYLLKPFDKEKLSLVLNRYLNNQKHAEFEKLINDSFITKTQKQVEELYKLKNLTVSEKPIFIHGETGTGKRVISHLIKEMSETKEFVELNCSQFSDELIASELFGHKKGAFTGATDNKTGLLERANNGILFLDEIHALSIKSQKMLLKAIEEKEFYPVGSTRTVKSNFRIISASCENIQEMIEEGKFRSDLFARISTFEIKLLPLRERKEDIELLLDYYISKHLVQILITDEARELLKNYAWPRNTREVQDIVENWIVHGHRLITPEVLPGHIRHNITKRSSLIPELYYDMVEEYGLTEFMTILKKEIAQSMINRNNGSIRQAAKAMNVSYSSLSIFLKQNKSKDILSGSH